nr:class I SAM-dependent methyltransferase [uncultured Pseudodesulfovibrio sp.]
MWEKIWDEIYSAKEWGKYPSESVIRFVARNYYGVEDRRSVRILDIGCGSGAISWYLGREGFNGYGIDGSAVAVKRAEERFKRNGLKGEFTVGDFQNLPYEDGFFDAVIDGYALCSNNKQVHMATLKEVDRVLKPEGKFYSIMPQISCTGFGFGKKVDDYVYTEIPIGCFHGLGTVYFFDYAEIENQFSLFDIEDVQEQTHSFHYRTIKQSDWIVHCKKKS